MIQKKLQKTVKDKHFLEIARGAILALMVKIAAAGLNFMLSIIVARKLGVNETGVFFLGITILALASVFGRLGQDNIVLRMVSMGRVDNDVSIMHRALLSTLIIASGLSAIIAVSLYLSADFVSATVFKNPEMTAILQLSALALIPMSMLTLTAQALQGLKRAVLAMIILSASVPAMTIIMLIIVGFICEKLHGFIAYAIYTLAVFGTMVTGLIIWFKACRPVNLWIRPVFKESIGSGAALYVVAITNMMLLWAPTLLLGVFAGSAEVGVYSVAFRTATLITFVLVAVNSVSGSKFAELYKLDDIQGLEKLVQQMTKMTAIMASPLFLSFLCFPEFILSLFGGDFVKGAVILQILGAGQFFSVISGSVSLLLMMSGHEKSLRKVVVRWGVLALAIDVGLIIWLGALGAACGAAVNVIGQNVINSYLVKNKLGIRTLLQSFV